MIARVAALGQIIRLGEALEVAAGKIVEKKIERDVKECAEVFLEVVLDGGLGSEQLSERAIKTILGDRWQPMNRVVNHTYDPQGGPYYVWEEGKVREVKCGGRKESAGDRG
jgi:hypothetical protein